MPEEYISSFGCFDGMIARRLLRRGPAEIESLYDNPSPLLRAIVEYKWRQEPDVKLARQLNWLLRCAKHVGPQEYKQARKEMLAAIKEGSNGNLTGYREFVKLIDNPQIGKRYDDFVSELIENSPKTKQVVLKLSARDDELSKFNLDYRSDYIANDSKIFDIIGVQAIFLWAFCKRGLDLKFNNDNTKSVILNGTAFKPFDNANNKLTLGSTTAKWSTIYGYTGDFITKINTPLISGYDTSGVYLF